MCIVRVRRNHLVEDALDEIARQYRRDLFKPLRVHFIGEEGIDAGAFDRRLTAAGGGSGSASLRPPGTREIPPKPDKDAFRIRNCPETAPGTAPQLKPLLQTIAPPGGVKKEFFQLLVAELLSPDYGMLVYQPESHTYWFNACSLVRALFR